MRTKQEIEDFVLKEGEYSSLEEMLSHAYFDFEVFFKYVIGAEISEFHRKLIRHITENHRSLVMIARGHGKSFTSAAYVVWYVWRNENKEVLIVSSSLDQSTKYLLRIKEFIEDNELLTGLKPSELNTASLDMEERDFKWSSQEIWTTTGCKIYVRPFNSTIRGLHVDLLIADDIIRDVDNSTQEEKAKYLWNDVVFPTTTTRKAKIIVLGTPITATDLLSDLANSGAFAVLKLPAVVLDEKGEWKEPLWKEKFTLEDLKQIRNAIGYSAFSKEYLLVPISSGEQYFPMEYVEKAIDKRLDNVGYEPEYAHYIGVDVALSKAKSSDYTAMVVIRDNEGVYEVVDIVRGKFSESQILGQLERLYEKYKPHLIGVELAPISYGLVEKLQEHEVFKGRIEPLKHTKQAKEMRYSLLQGLITQDPPKVRIPENDILLKEFQSFKVVRKGGRYTLEGVGEHDDVLDALSFAVEIAYHGRVFKPKILQ